MLQVVAHQRTEAGCGAIARAFVEHQHVLAKPDQRRRQIGDNGTAPDAGAAADEGNDARCRFLAEQAAQTGGLIASVISHDPDAPLISGATYGFVHWVVYNIPASVRSFPEGFSGYTEGPNGFGRTTYGGPMPPPNHGTHLYYFWVFALGAELNLEPGLSLWQDLEKIEPHTLGMNRLVGTYSRG